MLNKELPMIMHIDLNCCFAIIEQPISFFVVDRLQLAPMIRLVGWCWLLSYEAKRLGVKLGVNNGEARKLAPKCDIDARPEQIPRSLQAV